jgi:formate dehydrogenase subunit gamma
MRRETSRTLPDQKACTIVQPAGLDWRHFHEVTLRWIGALAIIGVLAGFIAFYRNGRNTPITI